LFEWPEIENLQNQYKIHDENLKKGSEPAIIPGEIR